MAAVVIRKSRSARARGDTREDILVAAEELFLRKGYHALSYQQVAVQLGIHNAAIHYYFPGKEDLGLALVQRFRQRFRDWVEVQERQQSDAWQRLLAFFDIYLAYLEGGDVRICPVGALASEFDLLPEPLRHQARLLMRENYEFLIDTLDRGRSQGSVAFVGEVRAKAVELGATLQGALQIARIAGPERFHLVLHQLELSLRQAALRSST